MAPSINAVVLGLGLWLLITRATAQDIPPPDDFVRAAHWTATVIDDFIYLHGGQVFKDGDVGQINRTLSIDCSTSWSPSNVDIQDTQRASSMKVYNQQAMFTDHSRKSFYIWGGWFASDDEAPDYSRLWRFDADGPGNGQWKEATPSNRDFFVNDLDARENTAYTSTLDGGFAFGGRILGEDGRSDENKTAAEGFVSFNFTTMEWKTHQGGAYSHDGSVFAASATFVEQYGSRGIIVILGGQEGAGERGSGYLDLGTVYVYDVAEERWYSQKTSGDDPPEGRSHHCAVGVFDPGEETEARVNGSYEIFVYGGYSQDQGRDFGDIYALSLPGFTWTRVHSDTQANSRARHACVNVGGNSQLVSLGGMGFRDGRGLVNWDEDEKDPYTRGIGIYDMNELEWKDSYDTDAPEYRTNQKIRTWYDNGNMERMEWTDDGVHALFLGELSEPESEVPDDDTRPDSSENSSSTPVGAIAGGVVGGVAGLVVVGLAIWFFRRRRRQPSEAPKQPDVATTEPVKSPSPPTYPSELDPTGVMPELDGSTRR